MKQYVDQKTGVVFDFNADFTGLVNVHIPVEGTHTFHHVEIPIGALCRFVCCNFQNLKEIMSLIREGIRKRAQI